MRADRGALVFTLVTGLGLAALLLAGASDRRPRAASAGIPYVQNAVGISRGRRACETTPPSPSAVGAVRVWAAANQPETPLGVTVAAGASGRILARGETRIGPPPGPADVHLDVRVPVAVGLRICFTTGGSAPIGLLGSGSAKPSVGLTVNRRPAAVALALVLLRADPPPLLSLTPTVFARAALFRPGWVGIPTYWGLIAGVLLALVLVGVAVAAADRAAGVQT